MRPALDPWKIWNLLQQEVWHFSFIWPKARKSSNFAAL